MNAVQQSENVVLLKWEVVALWLGRIMFGLALFMGQQLLSKVDTLTAGLEQQSLRMEEITHELHARTGLRWTSVDQKVWATQLAQMNPKVIVPEPEHIELDSLTAKKVTP